jgi:hypothetical protein
MVGALLLPDLEFYMALFLMIYEGPSPSTAKPLLLSRDSKVLRLVAEELSQRLKGDDAAQIARILKETEGGQNA